MEEQIKIAKYKESKLQIITSLELMYEMRSHFFEIHRNLDKTLIYPKQFIHDWYCNKKNIPLEEREVFTTQTIGRETSAFKFLNRIAELGKMKVNKHTYDLIVKYGDIKKYEAISPLNS